VYFTTKAFWKEAANRAVATAAQAALGAITADAAGVLTADWKAMAVTAAGAAVFSILTSLAGPNRILKTPNEDQDNDIEGQELAYQPKRQEE
jgi:hypothetical protein